MVRRWRLFYLIAVELAKKYTKALAGGFLLGLLISLGFWRISPLVKQQLLTPTERIGIVGDFTPNNLPESVEKLVSSGLTQLALDGHATPALARSWVATDSGKIFTFFLRKDAVWHDGKPVVASDINYNIKNVSFTVLDAHTLRAELKDPYSPFPALVSKPIFRSGLRGFGSYKVGAIQLHGDTVSYLKLIPVHAKTDTLKEYRFYRTETLAVTAYKLGEVDILEDLTSAYDLRTWGKTNVSAKTKYTRIISLFYNVSKDLFSERNVRHALAYALPKIGGERAYSPIQKTSWAYFEKVKKFEPDSTQAQKMFAASGISSESARVTISTFAPYVDFAQKIADAWTNLGLPTDVKVESTVPPDYQVLLSAQDVPPDPDQYPFWHKTQTQTNITRYNNVKIDKLLEDGRQELDMERRIKIYTDFQRVLVDDAPALFLYYPQSYLITRQ